MWLAPWQPETGRAHTLKISMPGGAPKTVAALRVWNYNKSEEDASRDARFWAETLGGEPPAYEPNPWGSLLETAEGSRSNAWRALVHVQ